MSKNEASDRQRKANQANALKSTGPKSAEGKARSRFNGLKHGMRAEEIVLPTENPAEYEAELQAWHEDWKPPTAARRILVERAATASWRLRRSVRVETRRLEKLGNEAVAAHDARMAALVNHANVNLKASPQKSLDLLNSFREGVVALIAMWEYLAGSSASHDYWHNANDHHFALLNLLGWPWTADHGDVGSVATVSWRLLVFNDPKVGHDPDGELSAEAAIKLAAGLHECIREQIVDLRKTLARFPSAEETRIEIAEAAYLDPSPEGRCLMRYEAQNDRSLRASIAQLSQLTKSGADLDAWEIEAPTEPDPAPLFHVERDRNGRIWPVADEPDPDSHSSNS